LDDKIQHAECLSPTGYSTGGKDAGCTPEPCPPAQLRSLVRLALACTTRYPSRLTALVSRVAPPRVLSRACITQDGCINTLLPRTAWPLSPTHRGL